MPKDRFSTQADLYARYRIDYPAQLYAWLLPRVPGRGRAWDCATGNGQVAAVLAQHFAHVDATDISAAQLAQAEPRANIHYQQASAEHTAFAPARFDLITVAQALHWFDAAAFNAEARRLLQPGGVLAEWGYTLCRTDSVALNRTLDHFHDHTSAPYWDANRRHIETEYTTIAFPFARVQHARFEARRRWTAADMLGYLRSWSAADNYARQHPGADLVALVEEEVTRLWGPGEREVRFPVFARLGYQE